MLNGMASYLKSSTLADACGGQFHEGPQLTVWNVGAESLASIEPQ